jgi:hypothetical protein
MMNVKRESSVVKIAKIKIQKNDKKLFQDRFKKP